MFSQSVFPPSAFGTTWSNVSSEVGSLFLQYWQVNLSLEYTFCLLNRMGCLLYLKNLRSLTTEGILMVIDME